MRVARDLAVACLLFAVLLLGSLVQSARVSAHPAVSIPFTLGPTFPAHTGNVPTTAPGQQTSMEVTFGYPDVGWTLGDFEVAVDVVEVHHLASPGTCSQSPSAVTIYTEPFLHTAKDSFFLRLTFVWPTAATSTAWGSPYYALCLHQRVLSPFPQSQDILSGDASAIGTSAVYQVMGDFAPVYHLSSSTISPGQTLTVDGEHWNYYLRNYADVPETGTFIRIVQHNGGITSYGVGQAPDIDANGNFVVRLTIPSDYAFGQYWVTGGNTWFPSEGELSLRIVAPPPAPTATPVPTATPAPSPTPTSIPTATGAPTPTVSTLTAVGASNDSSTSGRSFPMSALVGGIVGILVVASGAVAFFLVHKRRLAPAQEGSSPLVGVGASAPDDPTHADR